MLSKNDLINIEREYCTRRLAHFAKLAWPILEPGATLKWGWALDLMCEHLEAVTAGQIKRLLINVPPGFMKSLLTGVIWPAWEWGAKDRPELRYLGTAHKQDLAVRDSTKCRRLIQSAWYQGLWKINLTGDQNAKTKFENDRTGFREAMAFTSLTGSRADRLILDDPHSVDDANSRVKLEADIQTLREAVPSRVNNDDSAIVIIMQRLAVGDASDVAIELGYQHLCLPMEYENTSKWIVGKGDPRRETDELLFPERFSRGQVDELKKSLREAAAGQLQQRPNPRGGRIIKTEWFKRYTVAPIFKHRAIYADTAQKTAERNDYSVFQCWGMADDGIYLIDQIRGKWEAPELERRAVAFWEKHKQESHQPALRGMKIEDKASGTGLIQSLKTKGIPVTGIGRVKDKYTRLLDILGYIEAGLVSLPDNAPYLSDFLTECESFTGDNTHAHDDQVDPMIDAINDMLTKNNASQIWERMI